MKHYIIRNIDPHEEMDWVIEHTISYYGQSDEERRSNSFFTSLTVIPKSNFDEISI